MHLSRLLALGAIALWASLAMLGVRLAHLPPFWLTGVALLIGSVVALPLSRLDLSQFRVPLPTLALGVYGLFGFLDMCCLDDLLLHSTQLIERNWHDLDSL